MNEHANRRCEIQAHMRNKQFPLFPSPSPQWHGRSATRPSPPNTQTGSPSSGSRRHRGRSRLLGIHGILPRFREKKKKKKSVEYIFLAVKKMADGPANGPAHPGPVRCTVLFSWAVDRPGRIFPGWLTCMRSHSCTQKTCPCRNDEMPSIQPHGPGVGSWVDVLKCRYMSANADMDGGFAAMHDALCHHACRLCSHAPA